jgi:nitrous oxidase accessory protein NosD
MPFTVSRSIGILVGALATIIDSTSATTQGPKESVQVVRPGESIQAAIDRVEHGGRVFVLPGVYRETVDAVNGLTITKGIDLIGLSTSRGRVVLENAGDQRNGIVVVPAERTNCLSCHANLAPPFDVLPGVARGARMREPMIRGVSIHGFTIRGFNNNGLFTENIDGFSIDDVESVDNANYGIFPTLSKNGVISRSRATGSGDSGIWVETSQNVVVSNALVEGNVIGLEVSNSDDVSIINSESRNNSLGVSLLVLPFLFDERPGAKRITVHGNFIHDNNRENDAPPGSLLGGLPAGVGLLNMGADDSLLANNLVEDNNLSGITLVDACIAWAGTRFDCAVNPRVTPEFLADQDARNNRVAGNVLVRNGQRRVRHRLPLPRAT